MRQEVVQDILVQEVGSGLGGEKRALGASLPIVGNESIQRTNRGRKKEREREREELEHCWFRPCLNGDECKLRMVEFHSIFYSPPNNGQGSPGFPSNH